MTLAPPPDRVVRIAVLGCGNVGSALVGILQDRADALAVQSGARLEVAGIAVRALPLYMRDVPSTAAIARAAIDLAGELAR